MTQPNLPYVVCAANCKKETNHLKRGSENACLVGVFRQAQ